MEEIKSYTLPILRDIVVVVFRKKLLAENKDPETFEKEALEQ